MTDTTPEAVERLARVLDGPFYRVEGYAGPYIDEATLRDEHTAAAATLRALSAEVERLTSHHYTGSRVEDAITAHWGSRCYDFAEGCSCCEAWAEYDRLTAAAQTPPEDEAGEEVGGPMMARARERARNAIRNAQVAAQTAPEDVEPVPAPGTADAYLTALLHYSGSFYGAAIASGMKASGAADAVAHIERAARGLHSLAHPPRSPAYHLEDDVLHRDDVAVNAFARAMKAKLAQKRAQGRGGWDGPDCNAEILSRLLREHVEKGDPLDVGNLAMMLHQRGERITPPEDVVAIDAAKVRAALAKQGGVE